MGGDCEGEPNCVAYVPSKDMIYDISDGRPDWCPLIELPPHGRLIDADADPSEYVTVWDCDCSEFGKQTVMAVDDLNYLPAVIPADGGTDI